MTGGVGSVMQNCHYPPTDCHIVLLEFSYGFVMVLKPAISEISPNCHSVTIIFRTTDGTGHPTRKAIANRVSFYT